MSYRTSPPGGLRPEIDLPHEHPVELYHNALSMCSGKVRTCLAEKQIPGGYRGRHIHLLESGGYETLTPEFLAVNPGGTVPVLVHDGHPVYESHEQVLYIDKTFAGLPLTPRGKEAEVAAWNERAALKTYLDPADMPAHLGSCMPLASMPLFAAMMLEIPVRWILPGFWKHPEPMNHTIIFLAMRVLGRRVMLLPPVWNGMKAALRALREHLVDIDAALRDGREYVCGVFTLADVALMAIFERLRAADWEALFDDLPRVRAYWARLQKRPSYKAAFLDEEIPAIRHGVLTVREWKATIPGFRRRMEALLQHAKGSD